MKAKEEDLARIGLDDKKVCPLPPVCGASILLAASAHAAALLPCSRDGSHCSA